MLYVSILLSVALLHAESKTLLSLGLLMAMDLSQVMFVYDSYTQFD